MILENGLEHTQADYMATSQAIAILESRAGQIAENATNKQKIKPDSPFFLAVGLVRPHVPLIAPENCFESFPDHEMQVPNVVLDTTVPEAALKMQNPNIWKMSEQQKKQTIGAYMASVKFMDQQVGRLLDALDQLGLREETIVVFISDHGYNLGEHDCWSKVSLWEGSIRVPMIISYPEHTHNWGTTSGSITELIDLYPTLVDLCGLNSEKPDILQGNSLMGYLTGNQPVDDNRIAYTITSQGRDASIRSDRWRYTRWGDVIDQGNEELYDHLNDPEEHVNLVHKQEMQLVLTEMREIFDMKRLGARVEKDSTSFE